MTSKRKEGGRRKERELGPGDGSGQPLLRGGAYEEDPEEERDLEVGHDYLSDSAIGDLRETSAPTSTRPFRTGAFTKSFQDKHDKIVLRSASMVTSPADRVRRTVPSITKMMEKQHMPKFQAQRDRKLRKKNIARFQRSKEVEKYRGRVSAVCVSMELATDKLLPFLEKWHNERENVELDETGEHVGEWSFQMYTDVLHAHNKNVNSQALAEATIAVQQEYSKRTAARKTRRQKNAAEHEKAAFELGSPPEDGITRMDSAAEGDQSAAEEEGRRPVHTDEEEASADEEYEDFDMPDVIETLDRAAATIADLSMKHVFFFQYGCLVFWGLEPAEEKLFMDLVTPFTEDPITEDTEKEQDDMTFFYGSKTRLFNDEVSLASNTPLEKLSVSFALAQSIKLSVLEIRVEDTFESTRIYPQELAAFGSISLSQNEVSKMIGHLFIVKAGVNLESDMLSTPDFFWENDEWEPVYVHARKYLEVDNRVNVLNKRMEVLEAMFDMLRNQLEVRHATRLEWIIIWLIVAEVALEVVWNILIHDVLGLFNGCNS